MPTIKDVARLAGVSHGTVSNILNGSKSVNSEIVKRVEAAIKELGYQPNVKARSLRSSRTSCIGVLLPRLTDNIYARLYKGIERVTREAGYSISLYTTEDSPEVEEKLLLRMQQQRVDGAVIISCMPGSADLFEQLQASGIRLVFVRRRPDEPCGSFAALDEREAVERIAEGLLAEGIRDIALAMGREKFSNERDCRDGFLGAFEKRGLEPPLHGVKCSDADCESAFCAAARWLRNDLPQAVIATSPEIASGVLSAARMFALRQPRLITLDDDDWMRKLLPMDIQQAGQRYLELGERSAQKLLSLIEGGAKDETLWLPALAAPHKLPQQGREKPSGKKLRVLLLESAPSYASRIMQSIFTGETGIEVEIDALPYDQMYANSIGDLNAAGYDVLQVNIPWLREAAKQKLIVSLDECVSRDDPLILAYPDEVLAQHSFLDEKLYALPYMFGVQLLFYRKDLFHDLRTRRLYLEKYKTPLTVPSTWQEYDRTAEFFTRRFNPESPVKYGTTLCGDGSIYYYMLRLWEAGGEIFLPDGEIAPQSHIEAEVLKRHMQAFSFADPAAHTWSQADQVTQFCNGDAAMMVIFQAHFSDHVYRHASFIGNENFGFAPVPGKTSVLGGWSLCVAQKSERLPEALRFAKWYCEEDKAIPYNLLGGSMPSRIAFESVVMKEKYPWLPASFGGFKNSRRMIGEAVDWLPVYRFEVMADSALLQCLKGEANAKEAIKALHRELGEARRAVKTSF